MTEHPQNPAVRTGQPESPLSRAEFGARFRARFADPAFAGDENLQEPRPK
jgi:hypothetical protein